jgi:hypothetical protein
MGKRTHSHTERTVIIRPPPRVETRYVERPISGDRPSGGSGMYSGADGCMMAIAGVVFWGVILSVLIFGGKAFGGAIGGGMMAIGGIFACLIIGVVICLALGIQP